MDMSPETLNLHLFGQLPRIRLVSPSWCVCCKQSICWGSKLSRDVVAIRCFFIFVFDIFPVNDQFTGFFRLCLHVGLNWGKRTSEGVVQQYTPLVFHFDCNGFGRCFRERYIWRHILVLDRILISISYSCCRLWRSQKPKANSIKTEKDQGFFHCWRRRKALISNPDRLECLFDLSKSLTYVPLFIFAVRPLTDANTDVFVYNGCVHHQKISINIYVSTDFFDFSVDTSGS